MRKHFLTYLALSTLAVAQPMFDLYGKNLTVFSAAKVSSIEIVVFVAGILLGPALVAVAIDAFTRRLGPKVNESTRLVLLAGFSGLLGLAVSRWLHIENDVLCVLLALGLSVALPVLFDRFRGVREWSRWLSVLALAIGGTIAMQVRPLVFTSTGTGSDAVVGNDGQSVFLVVLDEFPLYALLGPDGSINAERYPGFAELAAGSTWYRNNLAVSNFTHQAVPAILASSEPVQNGGPFLYSYPRNIFTLYRDAMKVDGTEPVTTLCPSAVCGGDSEVGSGFSPSRFVSFLKDAGVVYGQRVLPPSLRKRLPAVDQGWGGFAAVRDRFKAQMHDRAFSQQQAVSAAADELIASPTPIVEVVHALMPHAPWRLTPDQRIAPLSPEIGTINPEDDDGVRDTYQTFLNQMAATDGAIKKVIEKLRSSGKWDSTMVVLTADHGISFLPTMPQRHTDFLDMGQADDIYRVPTFIKYPGQTEPAVSDCATSNLDILPTINAVMKTTTSWSFAGRALNGACPGRTSRVVHSITGETADMMRGFEATKERAEYYAGVVTNVGPAPRIAAVGASADIVGTPLQSDAASSLVGSWKLNQAAAFRTIDGSEGSTVPATVTGRISLKAPAIEGTEGIITVDGIAAGVIGEMGGQEGEVKFTAVLDYSLLTKGSHEVRLFIRDENGVITSAGLPTG
ncbi:MAG: hypothetical protein RL573_1522 [Actinomycetota bacterium]